jgi:ADP-dependent NAD(P)H-hydrate dehydratase / NAD(P)H-hydrate epimerase
MSEPPAGPAPAPDVARRRRRRILAAAVPAAIALGLLVAYRPVLGAFARHAAASRGVDLDFDHIALGGGGLVLTNARFGLAGVGGLAVTADEVRLATRGLDVTSVEAEGVKVDVEGSATDRVIELAAWSGDHADTYRTTGWAGPMHVTWRARAADAPWLDVPAGWLRSASGQVTFGAHTASVGGVPVGSIDASLRVDAAGVSLEAGRGPTGEAPIQAKVITSARPPRAEITLRPVKLDTLGASMGLALPAPGAVASGQVDLVLGEPITGSASLLLQGWVPPHPRELNGIVSGKATTFSTKLAVAADHGRVTLSDLTVRAGSLTLKGSGAIDRAGDHATAKLGLTGAVACADLVRSAAREDLGALGQLVGDAASGAVKGSATIEVTVDADSRDLRRAKVTPKVGVGCGLKL